MEGKWLQRRCAADLLMASLPCREGKCHAGNMRNFFSMIQADSGQVGQGFAQQVGTSPLYWLIGMQTVFSPTAWR